MTDFTLVENDIQTSCKTCEADLHGEYCSQCGQKYYPARFTLKTVVNNIVSQLLTIDRGVINTVLALVQKPGETVVQYTSGKTIVFTNPFRYFLLWIAVAQLLAFWSGAAAEFIEGFVNGGGLEADANKIISHLTKYYVLWLAGAFPFLVLGTFVFFWPSRKNMAEHTIFHLFMSGQFALYVSLAFIIQVVFGDYAGAPAFLISFIAGMVGATLASIEFFQVSKFRAIVLTPLAIGLSVIIYVLTIGFSIKVMFY